VYLDDELRAVRPDATTTFDGLQGMGKHRRPSSSFDLLHLDGEDLAPRPLLERKAKLEPCCVARRQASDSTDRCALQAGQSRHMGQTKALNRLEFVVVGWTDPEGSRPALGSLLLGYYDDDGKLIYAGRAGTGMTDTELRALLKRLRPLASDKMPLAAPPPKNSPRQAARAFARALGQPETRR
jgi:ATP-dependent DNA ligase